MKRFTFTFAVLALVAVGFYSCSKTELAPEDEGLIPKVVLDNITRLGFSTDQVVHDAKEGGYIVEGDIFLSYDDLKSDPEVIRLPFEEQYHTNNLVKVSGSSRTITIGLDAAFTLPIYSDALDIALQRYNDEGLELVFSRTSNFRKANIQIVAFYELPSGGFVTLGSAGFPTRRGDPYRQIKLNTWYYDQQTDVDQLATTIAHEIGHCIGFRHTDYMDRSYSCGSGGNEGSAGVGANHIPGTPTGPDPGSWMLACSGGNRPFNNNDQTALDYLY